jgi:hypothetical protein
MKNLAKSSWNENEKYYSCDGDEKTHRFIIFGVFNLPHPHLKRA